MANPTGFFFDDAGKRNLVIVLGDAFFAVHDSAKCIEGLFSSLDLQWKTDAMVERNVKIKVLESRRVRWLRGLWE
jgi:hypothetical protein